MPGVLVAMGNPNLPTGATDVTSIDHARLLQLLYAHTRAVGMGVLHDQPGGLSDQQSQEAAQNIVDDLRTSSTAYIDYLAGRPLKLRFVKRDDGRVYVTHSLYDRDAGEGMFARVLGMLATEPDGALLV